MSRRLTSRPEGPRHVQHVRPPAFASSALSSALYIAFDGQRRCASQGYSARSSRYVLAFSLRPSCRPPYLLKLVLIVWRGTHRASTSLCSPSSPAVPSCVPPSPQPADHADPFSRSSTTSGRASKPSSGLQTAYLSLSTSAERVRWLRWSLDSSFALVRAPRLAGWVS